MLSETQAQVNKANQQISSIQYEIKVLTSSAQKQGDYTRSVNVLRSKVNEYELAFNNKKKNIKYEVQLDNERKFLDDIENEDATNLDISAFGGATNLLVGKGEVELADISKSEWGGNKSSRLSKDKLTKTVKAVVDEDPYNLGKMSKKELRKHKE